MKYLLLCLSLVVVSACGVDPELIEEMQQISQKNAESNLRRHLSAVGKGFNKISVQSDSTIGADNCKFGDGWATGKVLNPDNVEETYKCQTSGRGKGIEGCLTLQDFNSKITYAEQEGSCDKSLKKLKFIK